MKTAQTITVPVDAVEVGFRLRAVDQAKVDALKASIAEIGLQVPITVRPKPGAIGKWVLVAGAHRLEAAHQAGIYRIDCLVSHADDIDAELWEIDENLCRADLTPADRAIFTHRRKDLYLQKHPETGHGGDRKSDQVDKLSTRSFADATATATGVDPRTVRRDASRGASISERALRMLRGTRLDTGATLDRIKHLPDDMQEEWIKAALADDKRVLAEAKGIREHRQRANHEGRLRHMALVAEAGNRHAAKVGKHYPVIYADPPWRFGVHSEVTGREKSAENHYPTMDTDAICGVLAQAGGVAARDAVLFLWATNPMLPDALRVMAAWGFSYVHHWIWDKEVAGTGYWGRDRHELLLIGRRGNPATPLPGSQPETVHRERKGKHSAKPDWFAEQIERLYPGIPRIELFCRSPRPGWDVWGFEATGNAGQIGDVDSSREGPTETPPEGATEATRPDPAHETLARAFGIVPASVPPSPQPDMTPQAEAMATYVDDLYARARAILDGADSDYGRMMRATMLTDRLGVDWDTALTLVDRINDEDAASEALPADELYALAVEHVRKRGDTSSAHLSRYFDISSDDASALLNRMIAEKVLPLEKIRAGGRRKAVNA